MFKQFSEAVNKQFQLMQEHLLFRSSLSGNQIWDLYISSFKPEHNPVFRDPESSEHNCNLDKNFIRRYGNIVAIKDNKIVTMWDIELEKSNPYYSSCKAMSSAIKAAPVQNIFTETFQELNSLPYEKTSKTQKVFRLGIEYNHKTYTKEEAEKFGVVTPGKVYRFEHFYADLKKEFVDFSGKSHEAIMAEIRDAKDVFKRGMGIPLDTLELVKDLIKQGSLMDGTTHIHKVEAFIQYKKQYEEIASSEKDNWCWITSYKLPYAKFRNELIGTLCVELAEGKELNEACQAWNKRVDPVNYMKATAPITQKQIKEAQKFVEEAGYEESFNRRFAVIDDINVNEILHSNVGDGKVKPVSVFDKVKPSTSTRHKRSEFDKIEEVSIEKFMKDILPSCTSIEAFLENKHQGNLVALTTANSKDSKPMFKWKNNFSWTYNGNLAGKSQIKEQVKSAGGKVDGILRFSMIWNESGTDGSDLDAWCQQPKGEIGYSQGFRKDYGNKFSQCGGQLDLDNTMPGNKIAIENIYFKDLKSLMKGKYRFYVNQFSARNSQGFKCEIEFEDQIFTYEYNRPVSGSITVATVSFDGENFEITHSLPETNSSKSIWNIDTNKFHKVNLVCLSPNYWSDNVGNKHYFFMLENCKSDIPLRSFHNENLNSELLQHRKVMEVLGNTTMLEPANKQLCGLGFNSTVKDELILKLSGTHKRTIKIKF
jgi:hypothetical protein